MKKSILVFCSVSGAVAVMLGAMGAHYLKSKVGDGILTTENLQSFETGVRYEMYHTLALLLIVLLSEKLNSKLVKYISWFFISGIFLFSGSIYLLSTKSLIGIENFAWLGPVTPLGGLCFITGWILLLIASLKSNIPN